MFGDPQFWVLIAFIIFVGVVFNPIRKMLSTGLDTKIQEIKDRLDQAEILKNDTQLTLSEIKRKQNEVKKKINLINQEAKDKIILIEKDMESKLKDQMHKYNTLASIKIDQMVRDANIEIQEHISKTAIAATVSILHKKLNDEEKQKLINHSISELELVLNN